MRSKKSIEVTKLKEKLLIDFKSQSRSWTKSKSNMSKLFEGKSNMPKLMDNIDAKLGLIEAMAKTIKAVSNSN